MINRIGGTNIGVQAIRYLVSPLQRWIYRSTGGKFFSKVGSGRNVLLMTTKGRRTGKDRTVPIFYLRDGGSIIICNVNPGFERLNPWVANLRAYPIARLQIGREKGTYKARETSKAEVELYWPRLVALWPAYQTHFDRSGHRAIFVLEKAQEPISLPAHPASER